MVERFSYDEDGQLIYDFTVTDETSGVLRGVGSTFGKRRMKAKCTSMLATRGTMRWEYFRGARLLEKSGRKRSFDCRGEC